MHDIRPDCGLPSGGLLLLFLVTGADDFVPRTVRRSGQCERRFHVFNSRLIGCHVIPILGSQDDVCWLSLEDDYGAQGILLY